MGLAGRLSRESELLLFLLGSFVSDSARFDLDPTGKNDIDRWSSELRASPDLFDSFDPERARGNFDLPPVGKAAEVVHLRSLFLLNLYDQLKIFVHQDSGICLTS